MARLSRLSWVCTIVAAALTAMIGPAQATIITGRARVIDGDTLEIGSTRIRLYGIDAPETAQRCRGRWGLSWRCDLSARNTLYHLAGGRPVTCEERGQDDYGRTLAVCSVNNREINAQLVRDGMAWAYARYSTDYVPIEVEARRARRGVFAAENVPPWEFRASHRDGARTSPEADAQRACPIKGNISRSGARVYHMPWQRDYARTKINERAGERWFCTEDEAERAGWRRAAR